jgi:ribonuclease HII
LSLKPFFKSDNFEAGIDEAGRGCLAGPVVAAAVILPAGFILEGINDSKKLSHKKRLELRDKILDSALAWGLGMSSKETIDKINILEATYTAMHEAVEGLEIKPEYLIIDGNRFKSCDIPFSTIVGGDGKYASIAAASILAKTFRDDLMLHLHSQFPFYGWDNNKGYGTSEHIIALRNYGQSPYHRKSFIVRSQLSLF